MGRPFEFDGLMARASRGLWFFFPRMGVPQVGANGDAGGKKAALAFRFDEKMIQVPQFGRGAGVCVDWGTGSSYVYAALGLVGP